MPQFTNNSSFVPVPSEFIKDKLPEANPTFVKVYLYLLMLAQEGSALEYREIADALGILESDLVHAVQYWDSKGVLTIGDDTVSFGSDAPEGEKTQYIDDTPAASAPHGIANAAGIISASKELTDMFMLAQEILGKTITEHDMETIYWFYSGLNMPPEVILMLLEHCVSKGKNRMSYIETVAVSWNEMGLNTSERVTDYLKGEEKKTGFLYSIRKIMGIADRSLSQIEEKFLTKWHEDYSMSEEMIALAYEYCIIQTAKLSFPYMDKILTRWQKEGITTVAAAEEDNRQFKSRVRRSDTTVDRHIYEQEDLETLTRNS